MYIQLAVRGRCTEAKKKSLGESSKPLQSIFLPAHKNFSVNQIAVSHRICKIEIFKESFVLYDAMLCKHNSYSLSTKTNNI